MPFSKEIKEKIRQTYLLPLLDRARESGIGTPEAIRTMLALFHRYYDELIQEGKIAKIESTDVTFKGNRLLTTAACHAPLQAAARFYFDTATQETIVPSKPKTPSGTEENSIFKALDEQTPLIQNQTDFRDLCHEEINPIPALSEQEIRALLPAESRDNAVILYGRGAAIPLKITKMLCVSVHREEVPDKEVKESGRGYMISYPSLYQATEHMRDKYRATQNDYLESIWALVYTGKIEDMEKPLLSLDGGGGQPFKSLQSCRIEHDSFTLLRGVLARPVNAFGGYLEMNRIDMPQAAVNQQNNNQPRPRVKP